MKPEVFFFLGTEAELIKVFPVMRKLKERGIFFHIIASGQNRITQSRIFEVADCGSVDLELNQEPPRRKDALGLLQWLIRTYTVAPKKIRKAFPDTDFPRSILIIHGDTVSTLMGAELGHRFGMKICHIEAGLRSHHLLEPFPEEIDRLLASRRARIHFAPGKAAAENLRKAQGRVYNTRENTLADSLRFSEQVSAGEEIRTLLDERYFVFVMHRQENLIRYAFVRGIVREITRLSKREKCVFVLHEITKEALMKFGLLKTLRDNPRIILLPRLDYFDFMKVLKHSHFVITDGGSNQEELYYMGKPCLILRKRTERKEGIGKNAILFQGDPKEIADFADHLPAGEKQSHRISPSAMIAKAITEELKV